MNVISETLVHWTGRDKSDKTAFEILKKIVTSNILYLSYCPNYADSKIASKKTLMICFTDLPLKNCQELCERFGKFGIGFKKSKMKEYGANPVLYTTDRHIKRIVELNDLINNLTNEEMDREWKEGEEPYQFTSEQLNSLREVFGFMQEYSYKGKHINYNQREWRLNYDTLLIEPGRGAIGPGYGELGPVIDGKTMCHMKFASEDIDYLIVPKSFRKEAKKLTNSLGCRLKYYEVAVEGKWWRYFF